MAIAQQNQCESRHYYIGATIDNRYQLTHFIGAGGMACVYRAAETNTPHEFALKFLKDEYHNMEYLVQYFEDEASSMRDLAHPNIVRFYRFENRDEYSYIVMDYVDGFALSDVLKLARGKSTAMPLDEVVRVMAQIARALDAIHRDNFVHRDIKPSNVLIDRKTGKAYLTDLGITSAQGAKIEGAGTIAYMSPEQAETWMADQRSDIYAYGILLYEMLTGKRPFNVKQGLRGSEAEADLLRKHKEEPIPDVTQLRGDLPKELNSIIAKAMAKQPDERYQSVIDFAQDVHQVLKTQLSADLQDFATIQHRQIAAPTAVSDDSQNILRLSIAIGIAAIILAILIVLPEILPQPAEATPTPTPTFTPIPPTATSTPHPIEEVRVRYPFLTGLDAFAEPDSSDTLLVLPDNDEVFNYLRVGFVDGFRLVMAITSSENVERYGVAFRMQDDQNYHYFALNPSTLDWEIAEIVSGASVNRVTGTLDAAPQQLTVEGLANLFLIRADDTIITYESDLYETGSLAIYLDEGELLLSSIQVLLLDYETPSVTPTPSIGLADPLRFLRADVEAMMNTNYPVDREINCVDYIAIYDSLDRHLDSDNADVVRFAHQVRDAGANIYQLCELVSEETRAPFSDSVQAYTTWEATLLELFTELGGS